MRSAFAVFLRGFTIPFGATSGRRILFDGVNGKIVVYRADGTAAIQIGGESPGVDDRIQFPSGDGSESTAGYLASLIDGAGGTRNLWLILSSGEFAANETADIILQSYSEDATEGARIIIGAFATRLQLQIASGVNRPVGEATLVAGTVTVAHTGITGSSRIFLSRRTIGAAPGILTYTRVAGVSFTINSNNPGDTGVISYLIVQPG